MRWFYRPEETKGGRKKFHGRNEVFESDHYDYVPYDTIEDKCQIHSLNEYMALGEVEDTDFFTRFKYKTSEQVLTPAKNRMRGSCVCRLPHNPDLVMVQCVGCMDWFHPECVRLTNEEALKNDEFRCPACSYNNI